MTSEESKKQSIRKRAEAVIDSKNIEISQQLQTLTLNEVKKIVHELNVHQIELEMQNEELHSVQKELEKTKKRYFDLYEMAPLGYCTINKDDVGLIQEVNVAASSLFGIERNEVMNLPISNFIFQEDQDIFYFFHKKIYMSDTDEQHVCELRMQKKNGIPFWVRLTASSYTHDDSTPLVFLIINDINEIKKKELVFQSETQNKMLFLQSKYASMGETVGNIAHQWKQPLNAIGSILNSIKASLIFKGEIPKEKLLQSVETSFKLLQHLGETIDTFYGFLSQKTSNNNNFFIIDEFETIRKITEYSFYNSNIKLIFELHSNATIEGNANEFTHAMLNLILNSKNALDNLKPNAPIITVTVTNEEKNCVIRVLDNAGGILIEPIESIFDWHISSKENSSGVGLYITKNIIEQRFRGTIKVENREAGVCFTIEVPYAKHDENIAYKAKPYERSTLEQIQGLSKKIIELEHPEKHSK